MAGATPLVSGAQTRAVVGGLEADVVATNLQSLVTPLDAGLVGPDWARRLPNGASPASSVIAVITRPGNPTRLGDAAGLIAGLEQALAA